MYHRGLGYKGKMVAIPNGLDLSDYLSDSANVVSMRDELGIGGSFVVSHVGRADTQKDHGTLLKAFRLFLAKHPGSCLLLVGAGLEEKSGYLARFADYQAIKDKVLALGSRKDVPILLPVSDVFGLSSVGEGFPNVVAEAMASGVPCVVTDCGDAAEMVGDTGWTVPVKDAEAMASALSEAAAESQSQRMRRRRLARARAEQMFGIQSMVDAYQRLWLEMVNEVCVE
jgi:glycosyltransferase involved in cell wall biosynthesis